MNTPGAGAPPQPALGRAGGQGVRLLDLGAVSPLRSQALYHALGEGMDEAAPDTILLCRPAAPYFCVGYHQSPEEELDLDWCRDNGYPVIQRRIGGGTVFLDPSQLFYQCVFHRRRAPLTVEALYRRFLTPPVETLRGLGLAASLEAINEIEVAGRRIAGTGGGQIGEAIVVVGNLLFDFPPAVMGRAWRVPSRDFRRLAEEGLRFHLATLGEVLEVPLSEAEIRRRLVSRYEATLGRPLVPGPLTPEEEARVQQEELVLSRLGECGGHRVARGLGECGGHFEAPADGRESGPEARVECGHGGGHFEAPADGRGSGPETRVECGHGGGHVEAPADGRRLKLTRRVWVREWMWSVGEVPVRVTARIADRRIEELVVTGAALDREDAERRVLEALGREFRA